MFFAMLISIYTSRILLKALGISDYGIYNIVGGITTMFYFINGSMAVASSRFIAFAIGKNDKNYENLIFKHIFYIHCVIGLIIVFLIETVGLWFLYHKLIIPEDRINITFWVLQFSAVTCFFNVISSSYNAMIISHEKMSIFAYISIIESILKLVICFMVIKISADKLFMYGLLLMLESIIVRIIYTMYCRLKFQAVRGKIRLQRSILKELASFAGWNSIGNIALMTIDQGANILLNIFFGPIINASRGIATQVTNVISAFSDNIRMAINPQITKTYSHNDLDSMRELIRLSSVYPFFMVLACFVPLSLVGDFLLHLWLVEVPDYSLSFLQLGLIYTLVNSFANPIIIGIHATGKIRKFQLVEGSIMLLTLPLAYFFLKMNYPPESVYIASIIVAILSQIGRLYVVLPILNFPIRKYLRYVLFPCLRVSINAFLILYVSSLFYLNNKLSAFIICSTINIISIMIFGINKNDRNKMFSVIISKIKAQY